MADWTDVGRIARQLPAATEGTAHEGSPTYEAGGRQFARLRWDDTGREILQFWTTDPADRVALTTAAPGTYWTTKAFTAAVFAWLDRLDLDELTELLTDSWTARTPARLQKRG